MSNHYGAVDAAPVRVDFSFISPSLGIKSPQLIGTAWAATIRKGQTQVVTCPQTWTPPDYPTNLHACVIVSCSAPIQGDTPTAPTNPALDRHVGQRNLTVLEGTAGETMSFQIKAANLLARRSTVGIVAAAAWIQEERRQQGPLLAPTLATLGTIRAATAATSTRESRLWARRAALVDVEARSQDRPQTISDAAAITQVRSLHRDPPQRSSTAIVPPPALIPLVDFVSMKRHTDLEPGQTATAGVDIKVPDRAQGPWLAVHLAQTQNGLLTGGYTVLIRTSG